MQTLCPLFYYANVCCQVCRSYFAPTVQNLHRNAVALDKAKTLQLFCTWFLFVPWCLFVPMYRCTEKDTPRYTENETPRNQKHFAIILCNCHRLATRLYRCQLARCHFFAKYLCKGLKSTLCGCSQHQMHHAFRL